MRRALAFGLAVSVVWSASASGGQLMLPSGATAEPLAPIWDEDLSVIRLRFIVERLREPPTIYAGDPEKIFEDMLWLCETQIDSLFEMDESPQDDGWMGAVITLMDREVEFGVMDAGSLQLFEWFIFTIDGCELDLDLYHE